MFSLAFCRTRSLLLALGFIFATVPSFAQQAQDNRPKIRVVPRVLGTSQPELTRSPNDRVQLNAEGDLVIEGARGRLGEQVSMTILRRVHVRPEVVCRVHREEDGFRYEYAVANAHGARQWIQIFWLDALAQVASARAPEYWRIYNIDRSKPPVERVFFGRDAKDNDERRRLSAGVAQDGFTLISTARPGLIRMYFAGHKPVPSGSGELSDEAQLDSPDVWMSEWLRHEANRYLSIDANAVLVTSLGPKVHRDVPTVQAIRNELLDALRNPVFALDREAIEGLLKHQDRTALRAGVQSLLANATGLRSELYSAILEHY